jgi:hypothetical protein
MHQILRNSSSNWKLALGKDKAGGLRLPSTKPFTQGKQNIYLHWATLILILGEIVKQSCDQ